MGAIHAKRMHPQSTRKLSQQKEAKKLDRNLHAKGQLSRATSVNTKSSTTRQKSEFKHPASKRMRQRSKCQIKATQKCNGQRVNAQCWRFEKLQESWWLRHQGSPHHEVLLIEKKTQLPQHNGAVMDFEVSFVCEEFESGSCHLESSFGKHFLMLYREKMLSDLSKRASCRRVWKRSWIG